MSFNYRRPSPSNPSQRHRVSSVPAGAPVPTSTSSPRSRLSGFFQRLLPGSLGRRGSESENHSQEHDEPRSDNPPNPPVTGGMEGEVEISESSIEQDDPIPITRNPEVRRHLQLIQEGLLVATPAGRRRRQDRTKQTPQAGQSVPSNAESSAGPSSNSGGDQQGSQNPPSSSRPRPRGLKREGAFHEISRPYWHAGSGHEPPEVRGQDPAMLPENQVWQTGWGPVPHVSHVAARYGGGPCTTSQVLRYLNEQFRFNRPAYYMALDILFPQPPDSPARVAEPIFSRTWDTTTWRKENPDWEGGIPANKRVRRRKATVWSDRARSQTGDASSGSRSATEVTDEEQRAIHDILTNELPQSSAAAPSSHGPPPPPSTAASSTRSSSSRKRTRDEDEDESADIASVSGLASDAPERPTVRRRLDDRSPPSPPSPSSTRSRGTHPDVASRRRERLMRILEAHRGPAIRLDLRKLLPRPSRTVAPLHSRARSESRDVGRPPAAESVEASSRAHQASPSPSRKRSRDAESNGVDVAVEGRPKDDAGKRKNKRSKKQ